MEQFRTVVDQLNEAGISYWVDSGTLLGLIRDGEIAEHDHDLDISVWAEDKEKFEQLDILSDGYKLQKRFYEGYCHKYLYLPTAGQKRKVDIQFIRREDEFGWLPLSRVKKSDTVVGRLIRLIESMVKYYAHSKGGTVHLDQFPQKQFIDMMTLIIPNGFVESPEWNEEFGAFFPRDVEEYLQYRYGEWEVEVIDWELEDDGGIYAVPPAVAKDRYRQRTASE